MQRDGQELRCVLTREALLQALHCSLGHFRGKATPRCVLGPIPKQDTTASMCRRATAPLLTPDLGHTCRYTATSSHCVERTFHSVRAAGTTSLKSGFSSRPPPENFASAPMLSEI